MTRHIILAACLALTACASPITRVHDKYNALPFVSDADNYGVSDYWATPMETQARGGDCEDKAAAKCVELRGLGHECQVVVGMVGNRGHAVALVDGKYWLDDRVHMRQSFSKPRDFKPVVYLQQWGYGVPK